MTRLETLFNKASKNQGLADKLWIKNFCITHGEELKTSAQLAQFIKENLNLPETKSNEKLLLHIAAVQVKISDYFHNYQLQTHKYSNEQLEEKILKAYAVMLYAYRQMNHSLEEENHLRIVTDSYLEGTRDGLSNSIKGQLSIIFKEFAKALEHKNYLDSNIKLYYQRALEFAHDINDNILVNHINVKLQNTISIQSKSTAQSSAALPITNDPDDLLENALNDVLSYEPYKNQNSSRNNISQLLLNHKAAASALATQEEAASRKSKNQASSSNAKDSEDQPGKKQRTEPTDQEKDLAALLNDEINLLDDEAFDALFEEDPVDNPSNNTWQDKISAQKSAASSKGGGPKI